MLCKLTRFSTEVKIRSYIGSPYGAAKQVICSFTKLGQSSIIYMSELAPWELPLLYCPIGPVLGLRSCFARCRRWHASACSEVSNTFLCQSAPFLSSGLRLMSPMSRTQRCHAFRIWTMGIRGSDSEHWCSNRPASSKSGEYVRSQIHVLPWSKFQNESISVFSSLSLSTWDLSSRNSAPYSSALLPWKRSQLQSGSNQLL